MTLLNWTFVFVGATTALFILVNIAAYYVELRFPKQVAETFMAAVKGPSSTIGKKLIPEAFGTDTWQQAMGPYSHSPHFAMHPILHFMTAPIQNNYFQIGVEGVRYEKNWSDEIVREYLSRKASTTFVFGGSTVMGHALQPNQTISRYLNELNKAGDDIALNFGSLAYDQHREIEKLVYLLRSGYRPKKVVFLDGWNDILSMARSNMRVQDKVTFHGFIENKGAIAFTPGVVRKRANFARLFLESLPIYRIATNWLRPEITIDNLPPVRDSFAQTYDFREAEWVNAHWAEFGERHSDLLLRQIIQYYENNLAMIQGLAEGFGFKAYIFYQPMGLLDSENPFVMPDAQKKKGYAFVKKMHEGIRSAISSRRLNMVDLSQSLMEMDTLRFIDAAHYAPASNKVLAKEIFDRMEAY